MRIFACSLILASCAFGCSDESPIDPSGGSTTEGNGGSAAGGQGGMGGMATGGMGGMATGGMGGMGGMATGGGGFGGMVETCAPGDDGDAMLVTPGDAGKLLLRGTVVTPTGAIDGEVLVVGSDIACVQADCSAHPDAATAAVIDTGGVIAPGMIDTHNHILFNIFDLDDWTPGQAFDNHNQWTDDPEYELVLDAKQYLNGESGSPVNYNCEMLKYGELKALIAGTTSVLGAANPANKVCYRTLARTIDQSANGLCGTQPPMSCPDKIQVNSIFPSSSSANAVCDNIADGSTESYVVHLGEGVDQSSLDEFDDLFTLTTPDGCLFDDVSVFVHGTAFGQPEFSQMSNTGISLVWSPASNVALYGLGSDLTKTTDIPTALTAGVNVSLAPDWSLGGSRNLLDELRFADFIDNSQWNDLLDGQALVDMVTLRAAEALALSGVIGELSVGAKADIMVVAKQGDAYESLLAAHPSTVRLVLVDGVPLYGEAHLDAVAPTSPGCETLDTCGCDKFLCVAIDGGTASNLWGQTFAEIESTLDTALTQYDAANGTSFHPLTPLFTCD